MSMKIPLLGTIFLVCGLNAQAPWSQVYKHIFTSAEHSKNNKKNRKYCMYAERTKMPFTQLLVSWNAQRPVKGYFLFKVRVRNAKTKKWDTWHDVAAWGKEQKSFFSRGTCSVFNYSRLEMEPGCEGDAFEVVVYPEDGAKNDFLKGIFVAVSHADEFVQEVFQDSIKGLASCLVHRSIQKSQMEIDHPRANSLCSPTSVSIVVQTLRDKHIDPFLTAQSVYDPSLNIFGNWAFNVAHAFELADGKFLFYTMRPSSFREIHACLKKNIPVAVSVRGTIKGGKKPYNNGHLLVVIGWNAITKKVICCDPAFDTADQVKQEYDINEFLGAWERSRRLTYMPEVIL